MKKFLKIMKYILMVAGALAILFLIIGFSHDWYKKRKVNACDVVRIEKPKTIILYKPKGTYIADSYYIKGLEKRRDIQVINNSSKCVDIKYKKQSLHLDSKDAKGKGKIIYAYTTLAEQNIDFIMKILKPSYEELFDIDNYQRQFPYEKKSTEDEYKNMISSFGDVKEIDEKYFREGFNLMNHSNMNVGQVLVSQIDSINRNGNCLEFVPIIKNIENNEICPINDFSEVYVSYMYKNFVLIFDSSKNTTRKDINKIYLIDYKKDRNIIPDYFNKNYLSILSTYLIQVNEYDEGDNAILFVNEYNQEKKGRNEINFVFLEDDVKTKLAFNYYEIKGVYRSGVYEDSFLLHIKDLFPDKYKFGSFEVERPKGWEKSDKYVEIPIESIFAKSTFSVKK